MVAAGAAMVTVGVVARLTSSTGAAVAYGTKARDRIVNEHFMVKSLLKLKRDLHSEVA